MEGPETEKLKPYSKGLSYLWAKYILKVDFKDLTGPTQKNDGSIDKGYSFLDLVKTYFQVIDDESCLLNKESDITKVRDEVLHTFAQNATKILSTTHKEKTTEGHNLKESLLRLAQSLENSTNLKPPQFVDPLDEFHQR